jgi:hypothetical protein
MTNSIGYYGQGGQTANASAYYQNIYDAAGEWGAYGYDAAHNLVANAVYSLPFGRNQRFGKCPHWRRKNSSWAGTTDQCQFILPTELICSQRATDGGQSPT